MYIVHSDYLTAGGRREGGWSEDQPRNFFEFKAKKDAFLRPFPPLLRFIFLPQQISFFEFKAKKDAFLGSFSPFII